MLNFLIFLYLRAFEISCLAKLSMKKSFISSGTVFEFQEAELGVYARHPVKIQSTIIKVSNPMRKLKSLNRPNA